MRYLLVILTLGACTTGDAAPCEGQYECRYPAGLGLSAPFACDVDRGSDATVIEFHDGQLAGAILVPAGDEFQFSGQAIEWRRAPVEVSGSGAFYDDKFHVFMGDEWGRQYPVYGARKK